MVDRENLLQRARHAYEIGRWKMAARVLAIVVPLAILCIVLSGRPAVSLGLAVLLGASVVVLRWRNRQGLRVANVGLTAGLLPLAVGVLISQLSGAMSPVACMSLCVGSGLLAGLWAGYALGGTRAGAIDWMTVGLVAVVTAFLGCINLGADMLVAVSLSLIGSGVLAGLIQSRFGRTAQ
jgi:hypothetical protein